MSDRGTAQRILKKGENVMYVDVLNQGRHHGWRQEKFLVILKAICLVVDWLARTISG